MSQPVPDLRPVSGDPEARAAEPCDEYCDPDCVHHTPSVGWDLSFGSRLNFHPVDTKNGRMVVSLHLSDDAVANGMVYRKVTRAQLRAFAQQILALVEEDNDSADPDAPPKPVDLSQLRAAVQLRDRCRVAAMAAHEQAGLAPSFAHANSTYDAIAELIREDERSRGATARRKGA